MLVLVIVRASSGWHERMDPHGLVPLVSEMVSKYEHEYEHEQEQDYGQEH